MAKLANTFVSTDAKGNREELSDVVNRITPEDTPIYSMMSKGKASSTHPEWETDSLDAPAANIVPEGNEYTYNAVDPMVRVGNYTQIMSKSFIISRTQEAVDNAGRAEKKKYNKLKKGIEIRKDVEFALVSNTPSKATDPRQLGSLSSWYETNVSRGANGANGGYNQGTGLTVAATDGTQRAFSKTLLDDTMQQCYESGANVKYAVMSPYCKSVFVSFMSDSNVAQYRYAAANGNNNSIVATADIYEGPYGKVTVMPNRVMTTAATSRNIHLIDPEMNSFKWLRKIAEDKDVARTGDAEKCVIVGEGTYCNKNEAGNGVIADVFGLTAST